MPLHSGRLLSIHQFCSGYPVFIRAYFHRYYIFLVFSLLIFANVEIKFQILYFFYMKIFVSVIFF